MNKIMSYAFLIVAFVAMNSSFAVTSKQQPKEMSEENWTRIAKIVKDYALKKYRTTRTVTKTKLQELGENGDVIVETTNLQELGENGESKH
jgi:sulfur relay (sulfurtransferase) DsrF/TusC family protein